MATVHASPSYRISALGQPPEGYPVKATPDHYANRPGTSTFEDHRKEYLAHCLQNPAPQNTKSAYYELLRLAAGGTPHDGIFHAAMDFVDGRNDCADFTMHSILRLLIQFADHPQVRSETLTRARETVLNFKYWPDEPGIDSMCSWTENHQILFASAAYLAGQLYPDQTFSNSGQSGRDKMHINRPRIFRWLDLRFRTGFSEWLSHVYYDEDLTALISLIDFCEEVEIRQKATMVTDLMLLDVALNSFRGVFGSSHGRSYENSKKWASNEGTTDTEKLLFGMGVYSGFDNMSAAALALSSTYQLPPVIAAIATDLERPEMENRQRMGIRIDELEKWGLDLTELEDGMVLLSLEAYAHPRTAPLVMRMFDTFNWWENAFLAPFRPYRKLLGFLQRVKLLGAVTRLFEWDVCRNTREEVNITSYRTPDYLLSTAQDYRPGYGGDQQHIWQATLGPDAVCFTTHPAKLDGASPNYWTGSGTLPRAAQVKNVVIAIYKITQRPALYEPTRLLFTHAWLPRDQFDELIETDGWLFARLGEGYLALRSQQPYRWQNAPGEDCDREIITDGTQNIWICELGRRATNGDFGNFVEQIRTADLHFDRLRVQYHSPSQGQLEFSWGGPLLQDGQPVPLGNYPRYDNPYVRADFPAEQMTVRCGDLSLELNWQQLERKVGKA